MKKSTGKRTSFKTSKAYQVACTAPAGLVHWRGEEGPFDPRKSQVVNWLFSQPEVLNYIASKCINSGALVYDPESNSYTGIATLAESQGDNAA